MQRYEYIEKKSRDEIFIIQAIQIHPVKALTKKMENSPAPKVEMRNKKREKKKNKRNFCKTFWNHNFSCSNKS